MKRTDLLLLFILFIILFVGIFLTDNRITQVHSTLSQEINSFNRQLAEAKYGLNRTNNRFYQIDSVKVQGSFDGVNWINITDFDLVKLKRKTIYYSEAK